MQTNRLFEIIYILLNKKSVTARELAENFNVSTRTIYRDVDALSLSGIPVYTEKGKGGGISLLPNFVLNKSILSEDEQNEILSALQGFSLMQDAGTGQVLQRLSTIFNKTVANWLEVDFTDWSFAQDDLWGSFRAAILGRRIAEFDYYSTYSEMTHRRVEPIQLWFKSRAWYLKAVCLTRQDMRLFKLTRVRNLRITDERFTRRIPLSPPPAARVTPDVTLRLHIARDMAFRVLDEFASDVEEERPDGSFIITVCWPEDNWLYNTILSMGEHVEVLDPPHIKEIIKTKAQKILDKYS